MPTKKKPASKPATKAAAKAPATVKNDPKTRARALRELQIDKPYYRCRVVGGRLEFTLYGGDVIFWPEDVAAPPGGRPKE